MCLPDHRPAGGAFHVRPPARRGRRTRLGETAESGRELGSSCPMDYRTLGRSGCAVSNLCLGTMTFGTESDEEVSHAQLDRFVEAGGALGDTADVCSGGVSEEIIGRWFAARPADLTEPIVLATKGRFATGE